MDRRSLLTAGTFGALVAAARAGAQSEGASSGVANPNRDTDASIDITHVFNTDDGESHVEVITVPGGLDRIPLLGMSVNAYRQQSVDWHVAPGRQFAMNIRGEIECEVSDGTKRVVGPGDPVFLTDTTGKGHITRILSPVTFVFLYPPQDWDIRAWAGGA